MEISPEWFFFSQSPISKSPNGSAKERLFSLPINQMNRIVLDQIGAIWFLNSTRAVSANLISEGFDEVEGRWGADVVDQQVGRRWSQAKEPRRTIDAFLVAFYPNHFSSVTKATTGVLTSGRAPDPGLPSSGFLHWARLRYDHMSTAESATTLYKLF